VSGYRITDDGTENEAPLLSGQLMDKKLQERRLFARHHAESAAVVRFNGIEQKCYVLDISSGGVQIKAEKLPAFGDVVILRFGTIGEISAQVVWLQSDKCGLQFVGDDAAISELVMAIAIYG